MNTMKDNDCEASVIRCALDEKVTDTIQPPPAKIREYVTFSFETDARSVDGVPVDRGSMTLTPKSVEAIEAAVRDEADSKAVAAENLGALRALFGSSWSVQWAEVDNVAVSTFAFQDTDAVMDQALAAVQGEGALAADPGLASAASA